MTSLPSQIKINHHTGMTQKKQTLYGFWAWGQAHVSSDAQLLKSPPEHPLIYWVSSFPPTCFLVRKKKGEWSAQSFFFRLVLLLPLPPLQSVCAESVEFHSHRGLFVSCFGVLFLIFSNHFPGFWVCALCVICYSESKAVQVSARTYCADTSKLLSRNPGSV